ncbi:MAG: DNA adenine methylase, partial [Ktedonobacteraceae bacterium]|nr:DNA adenine methylase [Ktedonobacteraceae bacterium]
MVQQLRSPLKWIGGKYHSAARILAAFPPLTDYTTYTEPCGGAAHILMLKPNWGHQEIYNDLNDDLCNFWQQLQDNADELVQRLQALPYSRKLYYDYYIRLFDGRQIESVERAVLWFYVLRSTSTGWLRESPVGWNNTVSNAVAYRSMLELFAP